MVVLIWPILLLPDKTTSNLGSAGHYREEKKRKWVKRQLVCAPTTGEEQFFRCAAQVARLNRHRTGCKPEAVCLVTSRPESGLAPGQWLEANNIAQWGIETGLHARLDASRYDDRCRLPKHNPTRCSRVLAEPSRFLVGEIKLD